jgi:hypothetical protein
MTRLAPAGDAPVPRPFPSTRYTFETPLSLHWGRHTYRAVDRMLMRPVSVVVDTTEEGSSLIATAKAMAARRSPHLVDIYACGDDGRFHFVVFERPASTMSTPTYDLVFVPWSEDDVARIDGDPTRGFQLRCFTLTAVGCLDDAVDQPWRTDHYSFREGGC